jgi:hypothetical protein
MYTVHGRPPAINELTDIWVDADSAGRQAITPATNEIDQRLARDPHNEGESRPNNRRILFVSPLAVLYRVLDAASVVQVLHVWRY